MDIHECTDCVRRHFYEADYLSLEYTLPIEAYSLNRTLQYRICQAWNRFKNNGTELIRRECVLLAEAWLISAPDYTKPMYVDSAWRAPCANCKKSFHAHHPHKENNPKNDPVDRWVCIDDTDSIYEATEYKMPMSGGHPKDGDPEPQDRAARDRIFEAELAQAKERLQKTLDSRPR